LTIRICVSILPKTATEAISLIEKAEESHADLVEVRLDSLKDTTDLKSLASGRVPRIATSRRAAVTESDPQQTLLHAAKVGFEYVDIDVHTPNLKEDIKEIINFGAKPIVSFHDLLGPLETSKLEAILEKEMICQAEVCKIVTTARSIADNLPLLDFTSKASRKTKVVCFAMGEQGKISRLLAPIFGAFFTFASLERGSETAPGQMTIQEMRSSYKLLGL